MLGKRKIDALTEPKDRPAKRAKKSAQKPAYVAAIPVKLSPIVHSSDETSDGTSGSESETFELPEKRLRIKWKERGKIKTRIIKPNNSGKDNEDPRIKNLLKIFPEEAFDYYASESKVQVKERLALSFGLNTMQSLSKSKNKSYKRAMRRPIRSEELSINQFGFLWQSKWEMSSNQGKTWKRVDWETAKTYYRQYKKHNKEQAQEFLTRQEKPPCTKSQNNKKKDGKNGKKDPTMNDIVPYREIRDMINRHSGTKKLVRHLRKKRPGAEVYLNTCDADLVSLRAEEKNEGTYSHYDRMCEEHQQETGHVLEIGSVGYLIPSTSTPQSPHQALLAIGAELDLWVRNQTAKKGFLKGVYFAEPSSIIRVPPGQDTITETFSKPSEPNYKSPQEMPIMVDQVLEQRKLEPESSMRFDARGAIITQMPERMQRNHLRAWENRNGLIVRWTLRQLKAVRAISQSHYSAKKWADNLWNGLPKLKKSKLKNGTLRQMLISLVSRLFSSYDVLSQAENVLLKNETGSFQKICKRSDNPIL